MNCSIKKMVILLFLVMFYVSAWGGLDVGCDRHVELPGYPDIETRESVKKIIEDNNIPLSMVVDLYNSFMKNSSSCFYNSDVIAGCFNEWIDITILKSDLSIVSIATVSQDNWYKSCLIMDSYPENEMRNVCFENIYTDEIEGAEFCSYYSF